MDERTIRAKIQAIDKTLAELDEQLERGYIDFGRYSRLKTDWERQKAELEAQLSDTSASRESQVSHGGHFETQQGPSPVITKAFKQERPMANIPSTMYSQLREALLDCGPFGDDGQLRSVFAHAKLSPWRHSVRQASSPAERVDATIAFLLEKRRADTKENALALLLRVLAERLDPADECHPRLAGLADELERALGGGVPVSSLTPEADATGGSWNTSTVRALLSAAFSDGELTTLCFDHFRPVYEDLSSDMSKGQKIQHLLDHCTRHDQLEDLVSLVREYNPAQYARFERRLRD